MTKNDKLNTTFAEKMEPAKIVQKPMNKDVKEAAKVKLDATVKGKPKPEVEWFKNDAKLEPTDKLKIETKEVCNEAIDTCQNW